MEAIALLRLQIEEYQKLHGDLKPIYLEAAPHVFVQLKRELIQEGLTHLVKDTYVVIDGVDIFPVGAGTTTKPPPPPKPPNP